MSPLPGRGTARFTWFASSAAAWTPDAAERMAAPRPDCCVPTKRPASERSEPTKFAALRLPRTNRWLRTVPVSAPPPGLACRDSVRPTVRAPNICASDDAADANHATIASSDIQADVLSELFMVGTGYIGAWPNRRRVSMRRDRSSLSALCALGGSELVSRPSAEPSCRLYSVNATGPSEVRATVCSKWALHRPSTVT
jgi:hypothetical protein